MATQIKRQSNHRLKLSITKVIQGLDILFAVFVTLYFLIYGRGMLGLNYTTYYTLIVLGMALLGGLSKNKNIIFVSNLLLGLILILGAILFAELVLVD